MISEPRNNYPHKPMTDITAKSSKEDILTAAIELTDDLYQQNYVLKEERKILWICVGILITSLFVF